MKLNVAVVFGGKSTEHEVSIISALQAIENMDKSKYEILPIYMDKTGDFYYSKDNYLVDSNNYKNMSKLKKSCERITFIKDLKHTYIREIKSSLFGNKINKVVDVVFPIVHGTNVEDGNLQGYFHTLNIPLVGPNCLAAAVSMDKYVMKEYCKSIGIPVIDAVRLDKNDLKDANTTLDDLEKSFNYPMIVKPVNLGSSIGITKVADREELKNGLELALTFSSVVLVEKAITNMREINCAVIGNIYDAECSLLEEPFGNDAILSFADKYLSGSKGSNTKFGGQKLNVGSKTENVGAKSGMASLKRKVPAVLDERSANLIKEYSKMIFKYIGCSGVSRIDYIIDKDTNQIYANEINPIPGSLSYYLFKPMGIEYKDLIDKIISIALDNFKMEERLEYTFENNLLK